MLNGTLQSDMTGTMTAGHALRCASPIAGSARCPDLCFGTSSVSSHAVNE
jgi:hypothetical protein